MKAIKTKIVWRNVLIFIIVHLFASIGLTCLRTKAFWFQISYGYIAAFGINAGAHRLWTHRSFKANKKLQIILMIFQTICIQNDIIEWVRDHRVHHKFAETNADPHNIKRGFFFAHMGWLMCKKHPDVGKFGATVDLSDVERNPILRFQRRFYIPLVLIFSFIIPTYLSSIFFKISLLNSFFTCCSRLVLCWHITWLTNSAAHFGSWKLYDQKIGASDSRILGLLCLGEGWHNYHHTFPKDYKTSEKHIYLLNFSTAFIDFFKLIGWTADVVEASPELIEKVKRKVILETNIKL